MSNPNDQVTVKIDTAAGRDALAERYDDLTEIGRGGMGIVFRARDRQSGDTVAVKVLRAEVMADADAVERFKDELRLARRITHKNVCRVYEINQFGPIAAISMEFVPGDSLRALLDRVGSLSVRHGTAILLQILDGLGEAHAQGVIHRDLKPENILIDKHGHVKVMDFGIARATGGRERTTNTVTGTPAYMSPEQITGKPVDARSDLYSLGLMMYEMFCGQQAFTADDPMVLMAKQTVDVPPRPRDIDLDLPVRIERAILGCLEKAPERRFTSAADVARALTIEDAPRHATPARPDNLPVSLLHWQQWDWALLLLAIIGGIGFAQAYQAYTLAHQSQLTFDVAALSQIGRDYRERLGLPPAAITRTSVIGNQGETMYAGVNAGHYSARAIAGREARLFTWSMSFADRSYLEIDHAGQLRWINTESSDPSRPPLPEDAARSKAEQGLKDWYRVDAADLVPIGSSTYGPRRTFTWESRSTVEGLTPRFTLGVSQNRIEFGSRFLATPPGYTLPSRPSMESWYAPVSIVIWLLLSAIAFATRRRAQGSEPWHFWLAGPIAMAGVLIGFNYLGGSQMANRMAVASAIGLSITTTWLLLCGLIERVIARWDARKLTSLRLLCSRMALTTPVGLSVVRGALVGVALLGVDAAAVWAATRFFGATLDLDVHVWFVSMGLRLGALVALVAALVQGIWIGSFTAVAVALVRQWTKAKPIYPVAAAAALALTGAHFSMGALGEPQFVIAVLFLDFAVLAFTFQRFDLLTVFAAVFTFSIWAGMAPLLTILQQVSTSGPRLILGLWFVAVIAAALIAAQGPLKMIYRRAAVDLDS